MSTEGESRVTQRRILAALLLFVGLVVVLPGALVLRANSSVLGSSTSSDSTHGANVGGECRSPWLWVLFFLVWFGAALVGVIVASFTTYAAAGPDLSNPADPSRPHALPPALETDKVFRRAALAATITWTALFVAGCVVMSQSTCIGHTGLWLYFQFMFWSCIVILPPCGLCGLLGNFMLAATPADEFDPVQQTDQMQMQTGRAGGLAAHDGNSATAAVGDRDEFKAALEDRDSQVAMETI